MHPVCRFYCRAFQGVFRLAIPILPYRSPKLLRSVGEIPALLAAKKIDRVLIVTDATIHQLGLLTPLKKALRAHGIGFCVYDRTVPNPTVRNVEEARRAYLRHGCRGLIGFGGGSAIDCAKAVGARLARPRKPISRMEGILHVMHPIPCLIAVPTTAGTGSETTLATVITDGDSGHKFPINDFFLIPNAAVLDAEITKSMPPFTTATTGMDALTHAIEAYIGRSTVPSTRADALEAARLIAENLETAYRRGDDTAARQSMLRAAFLAGRAFTKSYVGYCHAVAHSLGGKYNTPHGLANAVLLPHVLKAYGMAIHEKARDIAVAMHLATPTTPAPVAAKRLIDWISAMNRAMHIPQTLPGIRPEDIPALARYAAREANPLYPVPVLMDAEELTRFYFDVMEESK